MYVPRFYVHTYIHKYVGIGTYNVLQRTTGVGLGGSLIL